MKRTEAEREIKRVCRYEYLRDSENVNAFGSPMGPLHFYVWLENRRPDLLDFRCRGGKYQVVAGWVGGIRPPD